VLNNVKSTVDERTTQRHLLDTLPSDGTEVAISTTQPTAFYGALASSEMIGESSGRLFEGFKNSVLNSEFVSNNVRGAFLEPNEPRTARTGVDTSRAVVADQPTSTTPTMAAVLAQRRQTRTRIG